MHWREKLETIESLDLKERELKEKLEALRYKRQGLKAEIAAKEKADALAKELEKEIILKILSVQGGNLLTESLRREDVLQLIKSTPGHAFKGYARFEGTKIETPARNLIPIKEWNGLEEKLLDLPRLTIEWDSEAEEKYNWILTAPPWEVDVTTRRGSVAFIAKAGPDNTNWTTRLHSIPGSSWDFNDKSFIVPMAEGWRIFTCLEEIEGVVYTEAARSLILEQVEGRGKLDKIAQQEDSDDPRIKKLTRIVWNPRKQIHEPFHDWLIPFQKVTVEYGLECGIRFVLGHKTGLGKTGIMLAIAEIMRMEDPNMQILCEIKGANMRNWVREIDNLTGEDPVICSNLGKVKHVAYARIMGERAPYILISHDMMGTYEEEVDEVTKEVTRKYPWADFFNMCEGIKLHFIDEAHYIKTPDANRTKATHQLVGIPHVIPATATPVLSRTEEWWSLLHMTDPVMFHSFQGFKNHYTWDGQTPKNVAELHEMLRPRFIQFLKKDVQKDLPPINRQTRIVELSTEGKKAYELAKAGLYEQLEVYNPRAKGKNVITIQHILAQILRLKQICAAEKPEYVADLAVGLIDQSENGGKVLIFSYFKGIAYRIAQLLGDQAVCTVRKVDTEDPFVSMTSDQRDDLFEDARNNPDVKFIVTTEAAREGHNLEFCDWVIFNDQFWTPAAHDQCEGRAYGRLANPHTIDVFNIIADVDIEKRMQELLDRKLAIIEEAVTGVEATRDLSGSIVNELVKKIKEEMYRR